MIGGISLGGLENRLRDVAQNPLALRNNMVIAAPVMAANVLGGRDFDGQSGQGNQPQGPQMPAYDREGRESQLRQQTQQDFESGLQRGEQLLTKHPDMQMIRGRLEDLSKGYSGAELGALRGQAQAELAGQRSQYLRQLAGKAARGGVGGARAAAMQGAADVGMQRAKAEQERKMLLDSAQMTRSGTKDLSDYLMRQRFGVLGTGAGYAQLSQAPSVQAAQEEAALRAAAIAAQPAKRGVLGQLLEGII